jgi:hypothetical protein
MAMKTLQFSTTIQASAITVYRAMLGLDDISTYQQWTSALQPHLHLQRQLGQRLQDSSS